MTQDERQRKADDIKRTWDDSFRENVRVTVKLSDGTEVFSKRGGHTGREDM